MATWSASLPFLPSAELGPPEDSGYQRSLHTPNNPSYLYIFLTVWPGGGLCQFLSFLSKTAHYMSPSDRMKEHLPRPGFSPPSN